MSFALPEGEAELLDLTIRFSASLPDLLLSVPDPTLSTTSTLKQLIRAHLPPDLSTRRIRLIYAGKPLTDTASLSSSLKLPPPSSSRTPSRPSTPLFDHPPFNLPPSAKGKTPIRHPPALSRLYIHCSIGDATPSAHELAEEARLAIRPRVSALNGPSSSSPTDAVAAAAASTSAAAAAAANTTIITNTNTTTTIPAPRGFDRLLTTGFTLPEIQALRSQFLAIQAHTHTAAEMPSPTTLRELEDRWLDNSNEANAVGGEDGGGGFVDDEGQAGALDDMLWGAVMGFFWPMGCLCWLCKEEGVWTRRRKLAVLIGVVVNAGFGGVRWLK